MPKETSGADPGKNLRGPGGGGGYHPVTAKGSV